MNEPRIGWICPLCSKTHASHVRDCDCKPGQMGIPALKLAYLVYMNSETSQHFPAYDQILIEDSPQN